MQSHNKRLQELQARIQRLQRQIDNNEGTHFEFKVEDSCGSEQAYHFLGIKDPGDFKDQVVSLLISIWSFKDHFTKALVEEGVTKNRTRNYVFRAIRKSNALKIFIDLANAEKHSGLDCEGWSGRAPELTSVSLSIPVQSLDRLVFNANGLVVPCVAKPEQADYSINVIDENGHLLGNVMEIIGDALSAWEALEHRARNT
jgi:hypothetical protein